MRHGAWILTTVIVTDSEAFAKYRAAVAKVNNALGGEMLIRGPVSEVLEGKGVAGEVVVALGFANADEARAYIASSEYQSLAPLRERAGQFMIRMVG